jgi:hypothetical protein
MMSSLSGSVDPGPWGRITVGDHGLIAAVAADLSDRRDFFLVG